jgi:hypothetical protein
VPANILRGTDSRDKRRHPTRAWPNRYHVRPRHTYPDGAPSKERVTTWDVFEYRDGAVVVLCTYPKRSQAQRTAKSLSDLNRIPVEYLDGTRGGVLTREDSRKLGDAPLKVWRYLVLEVRGYRTGWFRIAYKRIRVETKLPLYTIKRAMARLREAGLVATKHERTRQGPSQQYLPTSDGRLVPDVVNTHKVPGQVLADGRAYTSTLDVQVWGARENVRGGVEWWVPDATLAWCDRAKGRGGSRPGAGRPGWLGDIKLGTKFKPSAKSNCDREPGEPASRAPAAAQLENQTALPLLSSSSSPSASSSKKTSSRQAGCSLFSDCRTAEAAELTPAVEAMFRWREYWWRQRSGAAAGALPPPWDARYTALREREEAARQVHRLGPRRAGDAK